MSNAWLDRAWASMRRKPPLTMRTAPDECLTTLLPDPAQPTNHIMALSTTTRESIRSYKSEDHKIPASSVLIHNDSGNTTTIATTAFVTSEYMPPLSQFISIRKDRHDEGSIGIELRMRPLKVEENGDDTSETSSSSTISRSAPPSPTNLYSENLLRKRIRWADEPPGRPLVTAVHSIPTCIQATVRVVVLLLAPSVQLENQQLRKHIDLKVPQPLESTQPTPSGMKNRLGQSAVDEISRNAGHDEVVYEFLICEYSNEDDGSSLTVADLLQQLPKLATDPHTSRQSYGALFWQETELIQILSMHEYAHLIRDGDILIAVPHAPRRPRASRIRHDLSTTLEKPLLTVDEDDLQHDHPSGSSDGLDELSSSPLDCFWPPRQAMSMGYGILAEKKVRHAVQKFRINGRAVHVLKSSSERAASCAALLSRPSTQSSSEEIHDRDGNDASEEGGVRAPWL